MAQRTGNSQTHHSQGNTPNGDSTRKRKEQESPQGEAESNIQVVIRCRNRAKLELTELRQASVRVPDDSQQEITYRLNDNADWTTYSFDRVFSTNTTQNSVFEEVATPILNQVLEGYSCTLFAYGQTGTGKTYTMEGNLSEIGLIPGGGAGIIPRVLHRLFDSLEISSPNLFHVVKLSMMEIYNEEIYDLLVRPNDKIPNTKLMPNRDASGNLVIKGLTERIINDAKEGINYLRQGSASRQKAATHLNISSSRSHSIFTLTIQTTRLANGSKENSKAVHRVGKFNLVDLAGSEDIGRSGAIDMQAKEAGKINQSLLALGKVISRLSKNSKSQTGQAPIYPIYRESKLTRILEDSLGGGTRTCIIATVSLTASDLKETISTLKYASQAKNITNRPRPLVVQPPHILFHEYREENIRLKDELQLARNREGVYLRQEHYQDLISEAKTLKEEAEVSNQRLQTLEEENRLLASRVQSQNKELISTQQDLAKCQEDLTESIRESDLIKTRLQASLQNLQKEKELTSSYANTESQIDDCAKSLLKASKLRDQRISELESGLVDFLNSAQSHEVITQDFNKKAEGHLKSLCLDITSLKNSLIELNTGLSSSLLTIKKDLDQGCQSALDSVGAIVEPVEQNINKLETSGKVHLNKVNAWYDELLNQTKALENIFKPRLDATQRKLETVLKKTLDNTESFRQLTQEKHTQLTLWVNEQRSSLQTNLELDTKFVQEKQIELDRLHDEKIKLLSLHQRDTADFLDTLDKESGQFIGQMMQTIKEATERFCHGFKEQRSKLASKHTERIEGIRTSAVTQTAEIKETLASVQAKLTNQVNLHDTHLTATLNTFDDLNGLATQSMQLQKQNVAVIEPIPSLLKEMQGTLSSYHSEIRDNTESQIAEITQHVDRTLSHGQENLAQLQDHVNSQTADLKAIHELNSQLDTTNETLESNRQALPTSLESLHQLVNATCDLVRHAAKSTIQEPTVPLSLPLAPYPTHWPRTSLPATPPSSDPIKPPPPTTSSRPASSSSRSRPASSLSSSSRPSKIPRFNSHSNPHGPSPL